jgi:hypothetical protein
MAALPAPFGIANLSDDRLQESAGEGVSANFVALLAQRFHYGNALLTHLNSEESVWSERESTALAVVAALPDTVVKPAGNPLTCSFRAEPTRKLKHVPTTGTAMLSAPPGRRRFSVVRLGYTPHLDRDGDGTGSE